MGDSVQVRERRTGARGHEGLEAALAGRELHHLVRKVRQRLHSAARLGDDPRLGRYRREIARCITLAKKLYDGLRERRSYSLFFLLLESVGGLLRLDEIRRDFQRHLISLERLGGMSALRERAPEFEITLSGGPQFPGPGEIADRFVEFAVLLGQKAEAQPGVELIGIQAQRLIETLVRRLVFSQRAMGRAQVGVGLGQQTGI